jgi:hypothetical protein
MKTNKIFSLVIAALLFAGRNYNEDKFPEMNELSQPQNIAAYDYELTSADITTIVNALRAKKTAADSLIATRLNADKAFSSTVPSADLIPYALKNLFYTADLGSAANVRFKYINDRSDKLASLSQASYVLSANDYKQVWGSDVNFVSALTPEKSPQTQIPAILKTQLTGANSGDYKIVQYNYSANEPEISETEVNYLFADFENGPNGSTQPVAIEGWINKDVTGTKFWQCRIFNNNQYAQFSSNNTKEENTVWLITSMIDLAAGNNPKLSFDVTGGYYNGDLLTVFISEDFNGTEGGITTATWTDVTGRFDIPTTPEMPAAAYGTLRPAGDMDLTAYVGKKIYVAFRYLGNGVDNSATTTYQIDNVKVADVKTSMNIASSAIQYGAYQFDGSAWKIAPASDNIVLLQPDDYTAMGVSNLSTTTAPTYLPALLSQKYPFAQEGNTRTVVFRTSSSNYADDYIFTAGQWKQLYVAEDKTEQYVVSTQGWMFDPTIVLTLKTPPSNNAMIQKTIDYIHYVLDGGDKWYPRGTYENEEHYYGFSAYYAEFVYSISGSSARVSYADPEIKDLFAAGDLTALYAKMDERAKEGMLLFAMVNYPTAQTHVSGIEQILKVRLIHYYTGETRYYEHTMKCIKSGTGDSNPAEFEYVGMEQIPGL